MISRLYLSQSRCHLSLMQDNHIDSPLDSLRSRLNSLQSLLMTMMTKRKFFHLQILQKSLVSWELLLSLCVWRLFIHNSTIKKRWCPSLQSLSMKISLQSTLSQHLSHWKWKKMKGNLPSICWIFLKSQIHPKVPPKINRMINNLSRRIISRLKSQLLIYSRSIARTMLMQSS